MVIRRLAPVVVALPLLAGCVVKKSTHQRAVADLQGQVDRLRAERDALRSGKSTTEEELTRVRGEKEATEADLAELKAMREADQQRLAAFQALQDRFKSLVDAGDLEVVFRRGQMRLKLPSGVLFPSGNADLSDKGQKTLAKVATVLMEFKDKRFLVAGYTDNVPIATEQFKNNWYLSSARAVTVVEFLIAQGFPADQLAAAGYADKDPVASNKTKKGRQRNRRIEIIVVPDLSELPKLARQPAP
ncbi:MAG TPA: OmpA family protein [Kofleriaceae bacterium]|jgi:chemotaxis protein MotB|nr:OmpA family protein [Kofleriaceae bacterium]